MIFHFFGIYMDLLKPRSSKYPKTKCLKYCDRGTSTIFISGYSWRVSLQIGCLKVRTSSAPTSPWPPGIRPSAGRRLEIDMTDGAGERCSNLCSNVWVDVFWHILTVFQARPGQADLLVKTSLKHTYVFYPSTWDHDSHGERAAIWDGVKTLRQILGWSCKVQSLGFI